MNLWMTEPFDYPEKPLDRGKVLTAEDIARLGGFARYEDVDGDGIGYRTLPGNKHPLSAYFTRGTGHNAQAGYSERPDDWEENLQRLARKHDTARTLVPKPIIDNPANAKIGIIAYGSADPAIQEARAILSEQGMETGYMRVRALPLEETARQFIEQYDEIYVVELNFDGQMHKLLQLHVPERAAKLRSVAHCDGLPLTAQFVCDAITAK
jgi:2-oxoglutarate ferredoxin oxidoreductase subunit alpha